MPSPRNKFDETIDFLLEELTLAIKWGRPSILLAVHKSKPSQRKAEDALKNKLKKIGINVGEIKISNDAPDAVHSILASNANVEKDVFFISNIDQGGGEDGRNAYRALNLNRETIIENKIKAVFWLTPNEEIKLPKYATDFWAFRHRVVEFSSTHQPRESIPSVGLLLWGMQNRGSSFRDLNEKIIARKRLLDELPQGPESISTRIELLYTLAYSYWLLGDVIRAKEELTLAVEFASREEFLNVRILLLNGLAILSYEKGDYQEALNIYTELAGSNPGNSLLKINLAVVLSALGKSYLAIAQAGKALKADPANAEILFTLGYLFITLGKLDDAVEMLKMSIQAAPTIAEFSEMLGICYIKMGQIDEARDQLDLVIQLGGERVPYTEICKEAIFGSFEKAESQLREAIASGEISKYGVLRDPALNIIFIHSIIQDTVD
jgi:tetratricopeptide (TPR) repeat protein